MKTIGLIGGMSWESTAHYYVLINKYIQKQLGGLHSAKILLYSVNFEEIEALQQQNQWDKIAEIIGEATGKLEQAGADFIAICTNTIHKIVPVLEPQMKVPLLHIADAAAEALESEGIKKIGLLGTKYTLRDNFYTDKLLVHGIETVIPKEDDIDKLNDIIFDELCAGEILEKSKKLCREIVHRLKENGAEAVILACTELDLLIGEEDVDVPVFDTTKLHAEAAAKKSIEM